MQGIEIYGGRIAIESRWLIDNGVVSNSNYRFLTQTHKLNVLRRGCKATGALVDYNSMPLRFRVKVEEILGGSPEKLMEDKGLLRSCLEYREANCKDMDVWDWFAKVRCRDGGMLAEDKIRRMANSAKILNAITDAVDKLTAYARMCRRRVSLTREFEKLASQVQYDLVEWDNNLPVTGDKLMKKWKQYRQFGCEVLVHGLTGRESNRVKRVIEREEIEAIVSELAAYGGKLSDVSVAKISKAMGIEISARRVQKIRKRNEMVNMAGRDGENVFRNTMEMQVDRWRPSQPMLLWCSDGWDAELYYRNEKSSYNRLNIVVVIDAYNDYPMGYAIGDRENCELIVEAYRDAINYAEGLFGEGLMPYQIQSDNYGRKTLPPYYSAVCRHYTPAAVGNAKSKVIEQFFRSIQSNMELLPNYSGHNITAKKQVNSQWLSDNAKVFPDREGCVALLEKLIEVERGKRFAELMQGWQKRDEEKVTRIDRERYLMQFGEVSRGNMLTPNGIKLIRSGKEYKFDCFDIQMRQMRGERWKVHFDTRNMSHAVAESEDGRFRFMLEAKRKVPMAIADYKEEDYAALEMYRTFNEGLRDYVGGERARRQEIVAGYVSKAQLEGDLAARLLTDKGGRHKDNKSSQRRMLAEEVERDVRESKETKVEDIYNRM